MKTPEPITRERLDELCELAKVFIAASVIKVKREELWALVDMAKQLLEYKRAEEDKRFEARTTDTK